MGLVPTRLELRVRRLQWYQSLARDVVSHQAILTAMFSQLDIELNKGIQAPVDGAARTQEGGNEWAPQFKNDVMELVAIDARQQCVLDLSMRESGSIERGWGAGIVWGSWVGCGFFGKTKSLLIS